MANDFLDTELPAVANFAAGAGDNLSFGLTRYVRNKIARSLYGEDAIVDERSSAYVAGEVTETAVELLAWGAPALLKGAAKRAALKEGMRLAADKGAQWNVETMIKEGEESLVRKVYPATEKVMKGEKQAIRAAEAAAGGPVPKLENSHILPRRGFRGGARTEFPMLGFPKKALSSKFFVKVLKHDEHVAYDKAFKAAEQQYVRVKEYAMPANAFSNGMQFDYERNGPRQDSEGTNVTSQPERTARPALLLPRAASAGRSQGAVTKSRLNIEHLYDESIFLLAKSYIEKKIQKAARKETEIKRASPQKAQASADRFVEPLKRPVINNIVVDGKVLLSIKSSFIDSALRAMIDELRTSARH